MLKASVASLLAISIATLATSAHAEEPLPPDSEEPAVQKSHDDLLLTAGVGVLGEQGKTGGLVSATALRQHGLLGYGATFEYGGTVFDYTTVTAAPMIGIFIDGPQWLRVGVAAAGGVHHYDGVDRGFISSSDPGAHGTTAFIGTRVFLGAETSGKARFHLGLQLAIDDDLTRARDAYTFEETAWTSPHAVTTSHTVGALRFGGMLALGTSFDL